MSYIWYITSIPENVYNFCSKFIIQNFLWNEFSAETCLAFFDNELSNLEAYTHVLGNEDYGHKY